MTKSILEKHARPKPQDDLVQTSIKIRKDQKRAIEDLRVNLSSLIRDLLDIEINKRKAG